MLIGEMNLVKVQLVVVEHNQNFELKIISGYGSFCIIQNELVEPEEMDERCYQYGDRRPT